MTEALRRHGRLLWPELPHVLFTWICWALLDMLQSSFRKLPSYFQAIELLLCDHLSVPKRPQYNCKDLLLWAYSVHSQQMVSSRSLQRPSVAKREGITFQTPICRLHYPNEQQLICHQNRHYFYASIHRVVFLSSNQNKDRIAAGLVMDICMVHYKPQIRLIHSANPTSYHLCMVN